VIYESLALGNPVIGPRMGGIPELIVEGVDGFIYEPGDMKGFIDKVNYLIANPETCVSMGRQGRIKAERLYAIEEHYKKIRAIYDLTINKANSQRFNRTNRSGNFRLPRIHVSRLSKRR